MMTTEGWWRRGGTIQGKQDLPQFRTRWGWLNRFAVVCRS